MGLSKTSLATIPTSPAKKAADKESVGEVFTWMQVSEAVQSQTFGIETHFELQRSRLDQHLSNQPAVLLSCDGALLRHRIHVVKEADTYSTR